MLRKILSASLVALTLAGATFATAGTAEARNGRHGAFAAGAVLGLVGGALLSGNGYGYGYQSYEPSYQPVYYPRFRRCFFEKRWVDDYYGGHYINVKVCN